jgi:hypothetical protein
VVIFGLEIEEFPPWVPLSSGDDEAKLPAPPLPTVIVYEPGEVLTGNEDAGVINGAGICGWLDLNPPAPPPPLPPPEDDVPPPPPPPATTRYSTSEP